MLHSKNGVKSHKAETQIIVARPLQQWNNHNEKFKSCLFDSFDLF